MSQVKIVRFKGKFKDLIPDGWTFQKLYARNYRQYHKTCDGEKYGQGCRIWQHRGGYLEIDNLFNPLSAIFVQQIIDGKINEWASEIKRIYNTDKSNIVYWFLIDEQENRFIARPTEEYFQLKKIRLNLDPDVDKEAFHAHYDRYREWSANPELIVMLQNLVNKGWIGIDNMRID